MPYRLTGDKKVVQVKKNGTWTLLKRYSGKSAKEKALAYLRSLKINTGE